MKRDLTKLDVFCPNDECADVVTGHDGVLRHIKRVMVLNRTSMLRRSYVYMCPVCGSEKEFRKNILCEGFRMVRPSTTQMWAINTKSRPDSAVFGLPKAP